MSRRYNNSANSVAKVITYIIVLLLILGTIGAVVFLFLRPQGMYIRYGNEVIADGTSLVLFEDSDSESFIIKNSYDWGAYSMSDCTVRVIPYADDSHNFTFTVEGDGREYIFNSVTDLSFAFCENGEEINVSDDGSFLLHFNYKEMISMLEVLYGEDNVKMSQMVDISSYPYFALQVVSPDGEQVITIPFKCAYSLLVGVVLDKSEVRF